MYINVHWCRVSGTDTTQANHHLSVCLSCMHMACFWCDASGVSATVTMSSMRLRMQTPAHEAVRSLRTAWAERVFETRKSAMTLVCCSARLSYLI